MNQSQSDLSKTKHRLLAKHGRIRKILLVLICVMVFVFGWFVVVRLISPWTVVKTFNSGAEMTADLKAAETVSKLRVGCYNIAHGRGCRTGISNFDGGSNDEKKARLKKIAQLLKDQELDIVVLNEVDFSSIWSGHFNQAEFIAAQAGYPYRVEQRNVDVAMPFVSLRFGNVILSKHPISGAEFLDYPHPSVREDILYGGLKKGVAATVTLPNSSQIQVVAVHLSLEGEAVRQASVRQILDLQRQSGLAMIAMGDFNSTAKGYPKYNSGPDGQNAIDTLLASPQLDTLKPEQPVQPKDFTYSSEKPASIIDWIFVSPHWQIQKKNVISTDLSDHLPVTAVLKWDQN